MFRNPMFHYGCQPSGDKKFYRDYLGISYAHDDYASCCPPRRKVDGKPATHVLHNIDVCDFFKGRDECGEEVVILKGRGECRKVDLCNGDFVTVKIRGCVPPFKKISPVILEIDGVFYPLYDRAGNFLMDDQLFDNSAYRFVFGNHPCHLLCIDALKHSAAANCGHFSKCHITICDDDHDCKKDHFGYYDGHKDSVVIIEK